jgi:Flp pilus assembly protein TadD
VQRDHVLFILVGVLIGFVAGYFAFERIGSRQPPRLVQGSAPTAGQPGAAQPAAGGQPGGDGPVRAPFLEQQAAALERQLEADPTDSAAALQLGNLYFDLQNWEGAVLAYGRYLELAPADPDVLSDLGVSFQRLGRADEALAMFDRAQELAPDHWQSRYNEVVVLAFQLQRWDDAREVLGELQRLQPDNPDVARLAQAVEERRNAA